MPEIIDTIFRRRSIRRYVDKPVERDKLELLLRAAMAAPARATANRGSSSW
jgi:nitroreductase